MVVKKSILKRIIIVASIIVVISSIVAPIYYKQYKEKQKQKEISEYITSSIDREYKDLLRDYEYHVKEALDGTNSTYSRSYSIKQLNELLETDVFCLNPYSDHDRVSRFKNEYEANDEYAKLLLKNIAIERVKTRLLK